MTDTQIVNWFSLYGLEWDRDSMALTWVNHGLTDITMGETYRDAVEQAALEQNNMVST